MPDQTELIMSPSYGPFVRATMSSAMNFENQQATDIHPFNPAIGLADASETSASPLPTTQFLVSAATMLALPFTEASEKNLIAAQAAAALAQESIPDHDGQTAPPDTAMPAVRLVPHEAAAEVVGDEGLVADQIAAATQSQELVATEPDDPTFLTEPAMPVVRFGVDVPPKGGTFCYATPTLQEIAALDDLHERAFALMLNDVRATCPLSSALLESVRDEGITGWAAHWHGISPLIKNSTEKPKRQRKKPVPRQKVEMPSLFVTFGETPPASPIQPPLVAARVVPMPAPLPSPEGDTDQALVSPTHPLPTEPDPMASSQAPADACADQKPAAPAEPSSTGPGPARQDQPSTAPREGDA
jgi:hypothetical protein